MGASKYPWEDWLQEGAWRRRTRVEWQVNNIHLHVHSSHLYCQSVALSLLLVDYWFMYVFFTWAKCRSSMLPSISYPWSRSSVVWYFINFVVACRALTGGGGHGSEWRRLTWILVSNACPKRLSLFLVDVIPLISALLSRYNHYFTAIVIGWNARTLDADSCGTLLCCRRDYRGHLRRRWRCAWCHKSGIASRLVRFFWLD